MKSTRVKNNVREMRIQRMLSKAELARRANVSVLTIDRVEKGYPCRMDTKRKLLEALELTLEDRVRVFGEDVLTDEEVVMEGPQKGKTHL